MDEREAKTYITYRLERMWEGITVVDKEGRWKSTINMCRQYRDLFSPRWGLVQNHTTFSPEETIFYSLDLNRAHVQYLGERVTKLSNENPEKLREELGEEIKSGLIEVLDDIQFKFNLRRDEIIANMPFFEAHNGRIDRQKYYDWAKSQNKQIPDEFSLTPISEPEPVIVKWNSASFDDWMKWRIESQGLKITKPMPYGFKAKLVEETKELHNYKDDSAVKQSWIRLGIKSSRDRKTRNTLKTP